MHSQQRYEICICLVILGHSSVFEIIRAPILVSRQVYIYYLTFCEIENFSNPYPYRIFESENFRFPFYCSTKNSLT